MSIQSELDATKDYLRLAYDAVEEKGGEVPDRKNLANLIDAVDSISGGPSLKGLKKALDNGTAEAQYPVGTEIEDEWDGVRNPLVVGTYQDYALNGEQYKAVGLTRKYVQESSPFGNSVDYENSTVLAYLNGEYLEKCSSKLKNVISSFEASWYNGSSVVKVSGKVHLPSGIEIMGTYNAGEGQPWELWRNRTGLSTANNSANAGRAVTDMNGTAQYWWSRSITPTLPCRVSSEGDLGGRNPSTATGLLPEFWIVASQPIEGFTFSGLRRAMTNGVAESVYPVGTEIPDGYAGNNNPLIVAQYLNSSNNSAYDGAEGAILIRKYVEPTSLTFSTSANPEYTVSNVKTYLDATYLSNCSDTLKSVIADINVPYYNGSATTTVSSKWFLMSDAEVYSNRTSNVEGIAWEYWKDKTGLASPSGSANSGRIVKDLNGTARSIWLRSRDGSPDGVCDIYTSGLVASYTSSGQLGVLPACFIAKPSYDPSNPTLEGIKEAIKAGDYGAFPAGTEIPDTYAGQDNPLIVAQYLDSSNNSSYNGAEGVILMRKYIYPASEEWGGTVEYSTSAIKRLLDSTYLNNCSSSLKDLITDIDVPYNNTTVKSKWFLMSDTEVCAIGYDNITEGIMWDYWKQKTGLSSPSDGANPGRVAKALDQTNGYYWLRSRYQDRTTNVCEITSSGNLVGADITKTYLTYGVLPACFIGKD